MLNSVKRVEHMYYDIVILPPKELRERVGRAIRAASKGIKYLYIVDNRKLIPHVTLFHIHTSKKQVKKFPLKLEKILKNYRAVNLKSCCVSANSRGGVSLTLSEPKILERLHREVVRKFKDSRIGPMPWSGNKKPKPIEALYRKRYGSHHVLRFFCPHVTLGKFADPKDAEMVAKKLSRLACSFRADTVAVCEVNEGYQVTSVLKTFRL